MTGSSDRRVRGGRVRTSREEKRGRERRDRTRRTDEPARDASAGEVSAGSLPTPDPGPFVETPAVTAVRDRIDRWLSVDRPVHLVGPTGCGKTALALSVAQERDRPVAFVNGDADLGTSDLVGDHSGTERHSVRDKYVHNVQKSTDIVRQRWVDNPLTVAVREGATLVYNEFSRTKPIANNVLLSVFEEGVLELPGKTGSDRYVDVHPEFRAILTSNSTEYAGVHEPQDALLDRLVGIHLDFYDAETERRIVAAHVDDVDAETIAAVVDTVRRLREEVSVPVGTRAAIMATEGFTAGTDRSASTLAAVCVDVLASKVPTSDGLESLRTDVERVVSNVEVPT
ncbi:gas vesicle protein GvpN [Natrinema longum]|uniref:Gas vesicle protein GvpN n=1 Tax=Natrinema longum TaxID=370324 RepID=A0A8A2U602_9EURY|nr:gas vesicle protein GvpN [Natrinema longum]MBZ6494593.1 gas vesicle protein GvpN [Natrinema longum]QSW84087.1 gas vesicle protein GvpN [Natrinema longum]